MKLKIKIFQCIILFIGIILLKEAYTNKTRTNNKNKNKNKSKTLTKNKTNSKIRGYNFLNQSEIRSDSKFVIKSNFIFFSITLNFKNFKF